MEDTQQGAETAQQTDDAPMSLEQLIASAREAGDNKLTSIAERGNKAEDEKEKGPREPTTAEAFAKALELVGEGKFITVKSACAIMEHQGWTSKSKSERDKYIAIKSAIYNRMRSGKDNPKMALPIDWSKSRDGLFAYKPIVAQDEAEAADAGTTDEEPTPGSIPTE